MSHELSAQIQQHFASLTDPRRRKVTYPLINIVTIALCAVIAGADDFVTIAAWGRHKRAWLARFLDLSNGIPSHDRFNAVFKAIKPAEFERCLLSWITSLHEVTAGQLIAIDGKTLRQSFDKADAKSAIHMGPAKGTEGIINNSLRPLCRLLSRPPVGFLAATGRDGAQRRPLLGGLNSCCTAWNFRDAVRNRSEGPTL